jgi:hypothetical protein
MCNKPASLPPDGMISDPQIGGSICPAPLDCGDLAETFRTDQAPPSTCS